jgi:Glycosyl hydrolase family 1
MARSQWRGPTGEDDIVKCADPIEFPGGGAFDPPAERTAIELIGGFDTTYLPEHDLDVAETSGHIDRRRQDLMLVRRSGIRRVRYPIRWHRAEREPGVFDWSETDAAFDLLEELGLDPIVDFVHHTSYPLWLRRGFADPDFGTAFLRYVECVFARYPQIRAYTLMNEPFSTLFLGGHEGIWPPYGSSVESFVSLLCNVLPSVREASRQCKVERPSARHMWCDSCERHTGGDISGQRYADYANDRRFFVLDVMLGLVDGVGDRPFVADAVRNGGRGLLAAGERGHVDAVGLDYYAHCQWHFAAGGGTAPTPFPVPLAELAGEYAERFRLPLWIGETNLRGYPSDRATWFKYVLEQCELTVAAGVPIEGLCWFPFIDSCDWDSLLSRADRHVDPVGVYWLDDELERRSSSMSDSYAAAASGTPSARLPAYRWREPAASWLRGYADQLRHWRWIEPPTEACRDGVPGDDMFAPLTVRSAT